ncbi:hypothetical protein L1987_70692 [Smallanthus sonchifolius]|uniref:Uncharacterized protein n=1 Tax=Smallanthus sonchifolius TaxID=185202 RepID=A0ACB9ARY7_9ASTR|nr:hypothetical protein L1987_70692 [Smallanthus sonchifolius]
MIITSLFAKCQKKRMTVNPPTRLPDPYSQLSSVDRWQLPIIHQYTSGCLLLSLQITTISFLTASFSSRASRPITFLKI